MLKEKAGKPLIVTVLVVGGIITFGLGALSAKVFLSRNQSSNHTATASQEIGGPYQTEGFDFTPLRSSKNEWRGPEIGEKIDLTRLRTKDGKTLASMIGQRPVMVVSVNPDCPMCATARDEMIHLHNKLAAMNINYYLICFAPQTSPSDFFKYTDSLNVGAPSFLWNSEAGAPSESLFKMTSPSHLLLNTDGTVIRVWPGSYKEMSVRQRMAQQIIADTAVAIDTLNVLTPKTTGGN
ncbi:MAG: hypothetical protein QOC96_2418 [Acidobacteriota bacterium]|nr:hypothetical protein [Acidobacteriota bacterium]